MEDLQDTARLVDQAQEPEDTPRTRQLMQFVATAAVLHHEATELERNERLVLLVANSLDAASSDHRQLRGRKLPVRRAEDPMNLPESNLSPFDRIVVRLRKTGTDTIVWGVARSTVLGADEGLDDATKESPPHLRGVRSLGSWVPRQLSQQG